MEAFEPTIRDEHTKNQSKVKAKVHISWQRNKTELISVS